MVLLTGGFLVVGALAVAAFVLFGGSPNEPAPSGSLPSGSLPSGLTAPQTTIPTGLADGRTLGKADAPVTVDIWSDYQCPACDVLATQTEPSIVTTFVVPGTVKLVYHDAAFQGARAGGSWDESVEAAAAARCAIDENKYWQFHDWLFANRLGENVGSFTKERLRAIAQQVGLDLTKYDACMADGATAKAAQQETNDAIAAGINQTPTLKVNGQTVVGAVGYDALAELIRKAAASPGASSAASASAAASPSPS